MIKTNLFFNYYDAGDRQAEIDKCLEKNREVFDEVLIVEGHPTYSELFALTKDYPNDINCFCNSDVYFKSTELLQRLQPNDCYALTRDDILPTQYLRCSQDAWCFKGVIKPINADFFAKWGSDNRLAHEIKESGYNITNPSLSISIIHLHAVDKRDQTRTPENTVPPPYLLLTPTTL